MQTSKPKPEPKKIGRPKLAESDAKGSIVPSSVTERVQKRAYRAPITQMPMIKLRLPR